VEMNMLNLETSDASNMGMAAARPKAARRKTATAVRNRAPARDAILRAMIGPARPIPAFPPPAPV